MIKAILFDISGVLYVDNDVVTGAVATVQQLQHSGMPISLVTNTSQSSRDSILSKLNSMGFAIEKSQLFTAPLAVKQLIQQQQLRPYCLIHPNLESEFADIDQDEPNAVFIADAAERFDYPHLNQAFQLLMSGAPLFGIGLNRYFKSGGKLQLDAGPFIRALEFASGVEAQIMGKPAAGFFHAAVKSMGVDPAEVLMVGDDVEADVEGAITAGLQACLVKTGKYLPGDEIRANSAGARVAASVVEAIADLNL